MFKLLNCRQKEGREMSILDEAIKFAVHAHEGQYRKSEGLPFILHPLEVAAIASSMTNDLEVLSAAMLHDVIEDTQVQTDTLKEMFGEEVFYLVMAETEEKYKGLPAENTWKRRKEEAIEALRNNTDRRVKILWVADKLSNMRSFCRQYKKIGDALWDNFHMKDKSLQRWYYYEVIGATEELREYHAWRELKELADFVFEGVRYE